MDLPSSINKPGLLTHLAIEILHAELLASLRPIRKFRVRTDKSVIFPNLHRNMKFGLPVPHHLQHAPFARLGDDQTIGRKLINRALYFACKLPVFCGSSSRT
jgi:hypothetical protein